MTVHPRYGAGSLADILPAALAALGVPGAVDVFGLSLAGVRRVGVLLVDGLGARQLPLAERYAPTLKEFTAHDGVTCGFPSTTPVSLATLGTGAAPGAHGLVGFRVRIPGTDKTVQHLEWRDEPDPLRWQPLTTQFERAARAGVAPYAVTRPEFTGTGLTIAAHRGARPRDGSTVDELAGQTLSALAAGDRTLVYAYFRDIDGAGHRTGIGSPQWITACQELERVLVQIRAGLPDDAALLVTADHGQISSPPEGRFDVDTDPVLAAGVRVVAGEARVRYLYTEPGATDDVIDNWRGRLAGAARVISRAEAVAEGWFGPVAEEHLARVGDVVAICEGTHVVLSSATERPEVGRFVGFHGAATEAEMMIPLLVARGRLVGGSA